MNLKSIILPCIILLLLFGQISIACASIQEKDDFGKRLLASKNGMASLGLDAVGAFIPFATGLGKAYKAAKGADKASDIAEGASKLSKATKTFSAFNKEKKVVNSGEEAFKGFQKAEKILFDERKLQHEFMSEGHAKDFGVSGNYNKENAAKFQQAIIEHVQSKDTEVIQGTLMKNRIESGGGAVGTHYFNPETSNWVFIDDQPKFVAAWKLRGKQEFYLRTTGNIQ